MPSKSPKDSLVAEDGAGLEGSGIASFEPFLLPGKYPRTCPHMPSRGGAAGGAGVGVTLGAALRWARGCEDAFAAALEPSPLGSPRYTE